MSFGCYRANSVARQQHHWQRGAGRLEFAVVVAVLGVLLAVFLHRVQFYQAEAERAAVQQVVAQLRTALAVKAGERYLRGNVRPLAVLVGENPMGWLQRPPPNYAGEIDESEAARAEPGHWYFDRSARTLMYVFNRRNYFFDDEQKRLKFKLEFRRNSGILTNDHPTPEAGGLSLEQID
jgi:general secretion pathway protein G